MTGMVRRSVTLTPEQDAFVDEQRARRGWTRSLWFQELLKAKMADAGFTMPTNITKSGSVNHREQRTSR